MAARPIRFKIEYTKYAPPRKPRSAYAYYMKDYMRQARSVAGTNQRALGLLAQWWANNMVQDEYVESYYAEAQNDRTRYQEDMKAYLLQHKNRVPRLSRRRRLSRGLPPKPCNAYVLFGKDTRKKIQKDFPGFDSRKVMLLIAKRWKTLPKLEKNDYRQIAAALSREYKEKVAGMKMQLKEAKIAKARENRCLALMKLMERK